MLTNLLCLCLSSDLQQQSSQENKDVVSTVNLPLASHTRRRNVSARRRQRDFNRLREKAWRSISSDGKNAGETLNVRAKVIGNKLNRVLLTK